MGAFKDLQQKSNAEVEAFCDAAMAHPAPGLNLYRDELYRRGPERQKRELVKLTKEYALKRSCGIFRVTSSLRRGSRLRDKLSRRRREMARWIVTVTLEVDAPTDEDAWTKTNSIMNRGCHGEPLGDLLDDEHAVITWQIDDPAGIHHNS